MSCYLELPHSGRNRERTGRKLRGAFRQIPIGLTTSLVLKPAQANGKMTHSRHRPAQNPARETTPRLAAPAPLPGARGRLEVRPPSADSRATAAVLGLTSLNLLVATMDASEAQLSAPTS